MQFLDNMTWPTKKIDEMKYVEFFAKLAPKWFSFLEWLIIIGLILYLRAITESWYFDVLLVLSFIILNFYIYAIVALSSLKSFLLKKFPSKNSFLFILISTTVSVFSYFILSYIVSEIAISYAK